MATAMVYDTLKLAEQLEHEAGFDPARAKAMARIMAENAGGNLVTREDLLTTKGELGAAVQATREDLLTTKGDLQEAIHATKGELQEAIHATKAELQEAIHATKGELQEAIHATKAELQEAIHGLRGDVRVLYWMSGTTLAGVATLLGIAITIALHLMRLG